MKSRKRLWITWHHASRSRNLAKALGVPIFELYITKHSLVRHLFSSLWTVWILIKERPRVIFLQLSFLLLLIVALYKLLLFKKVIVIADCHTKALRRTAPGFLNHIFWPLKKWSFAIANISIVSNTGMTKDIEKLHHRYIIMPDKIPECSRKLEPDEKERYCVYISSFAVDEPFDEIFQVAHMLRQELKLYWTGKTPEHVRLDSKRRPNLIFTGYLNFDDYWNLIGNADCLLALTTEEDCLQSGAYEALSVEVPMVVSDTNALREFFQNAAIYTSHQPEDIARSVRLAIAEKEGLVNEIRKLKDTRNHEFKELLSRLESMVEQDVTF